MQAVSGVPRRAPRSIRSLTPSCAKGVLHAQANSKAAGEQGGAGVDQNRRTEPRKRRQVTVENRKCARTTLWFVGTAAPMQPALDLDDVVRDPERSRHRVDI